MLLDVIKNAMQHEDLTFIEDFIWRDKIFTLLKICRLKSDLGIKYFKNISILRYQEVVPVVWTTNLDITMKYTIDNEDTILQMLKWYSTFEIILIFCWKKLY